MNQLDLFPGLEIWEDERLYIVGNGFDIHHGIASKYWDFKEWVQKNRRDSSLVGMMDAFFSNDREFWGDIEKALCEYDEESITDFCEPENPEDFKYDHPGQWQDGIEDSIPWILGQTMDEFRGAFDEWVRSINISGTETDLYIPRSSKYLTFNYTETLEHVYGVPPQNVLHIHGCRINKGDEFVIGHDESRDEDEPFLNEEILLPYQNAYSEVIRTMNEWRKDPENTIKKHEAFFKSLASCKGVCVMGLSYSEIDMPYLQAVANSVAPVCKWILKHFSVNDQKKAEIAADVLGLKDYSITRFE